MKGIGFIEIYLLAFLIVSVGYGLLAGWATAFYRKKAWGQLSANELKVKQGTASLENRLDLFFRSLATGVFVWQLHFAALLVSSLVVMLLRYGLS